MSCVHVGMVHLALGKLGQNISEAHVVKVYSDVPTGFNSRQRPVINSKLDICARMFQNQF